MKLITEKIGNTTVFIQCIDSILEFPDISESGPNIVDTSISDQIQSAYDEIKNVVSQIAIDVGSNMADIGETMKPNQLEMEFNVGICAEAKVGVDKIVVIGLGATGEYVFKIKMAWDFS